MAEFSEVIRQANRLCGPRDYCDDKCILSAINNGRNVDCFRLRKKYPEQYEAIVMKWAKEHPVMTNKQKMMEIIAEAFGEDLAIHLIGHRHKCEGIACGDNSCESCTYKKFWDKEYQPPKEANNE